MKNQSKKSLIKLLNGIAHCDNFGCTTCGGPAGLEMDFINGLGISIYSEEFFEKMKELEAEDLHKIKFDFEEDSRVAIDSILNEIKDEHFKEIYKYYSSLAYDDNVLAYKLLVWTRFGKRLTLNQLEHLIQYSAPILINSKYARNQLKAKTKNRNLSYPKGLKNVYIEDKNRMIKIKEAKEREQLKKEREQLKKEREQIEYVKSLEELNFRDRLEVIVYKKINSRFWDPSWREISDDELNNMTLLEIQDLIDKCFYLSEYFWMESINKLWDKRNSIRIKAMNSLRKKHNDKNPDKILSLLLKNEDIPIEHYPYELAALITKDWFESLIESDRIRFIKMLEKTRLKRWHGLLEKDYIN